MDNAGDIALKAVGNGVVLAVKAVPGAKRSRIVGVLGDCLKIATSAPAEKGKANADIARLLASALDVPAKTVSIHAGQTNPRKQFLIDGMTLAEASQRLAAL